MDIWKRLKYAYQQLVLILNEESKEFEEVKKKLSKKKDFPNSIPKTIQMISNNNNKNKKDDDRDAISITTLIATASLGCVVQGTCQAAIINEIICLLQSYSYSLRVVAYDQINRISDAMKLNNSSSPPPPFF